MIDTSLKCRWCEGTERMERAGRHAGLCQRCWDETLSWGPPLGSCQTCEGTGELDPGANDGAGSGEECHDCGGTGDAD